MSKKDKIIKTKMEDTFDIKDKDQNKKYLINLENSKLEKLNGTFNESIRITLSLVH